MTPFRKENLLIIAYMVLSTAFIFYIDCITPLGFAAWILYFIPLFLSLYTRWPSAPFVSAGILIVLTAVAFFISPRDISLFFAAFDRVVFSVMLIVTAVFLHNYGRTLEDLRIWEDRYRQLTMRSPETDIVYRDGKILCVNPAGVDLFLADSPGDLIGRDLLDFIGLEFRDLVRDGIVRSLNGAQSTLTGVTMQRTDGTGFKADLSFGEVLWDGVSAAQIIIHNVPDRNTSANRRL